MHWKKALGCVGVVAALVLVAMVGMQGQRQQLMEQVNTQAGRFALPKLPFAFDALEPYIDTKTVDIHYTRHHQAYVDKLNDAIVANPDLQKLTLLELFQRARSLPAPVRNNAGGHWNHSFYWSCLRTSKENPGPSAEFQKVLEKAYGSFDAFKEQFRKTGIAEFGSGWVWLVKKGDGQLAVVATNNQDNPLMDLAEVPGKPLLACDVWEHAYYLKYLNRRDTYIDSFWNLVDWQRVESLYKQN